MKREDLAALGLGEDVVDKVMALHGADIEALKRDKATLTAERDAARTQLGESNGKLEGYDPDWKAKAAQAQADAQAQVEKLQRSYAAKEQTAALQFTSESARKAFAAELEAKALPLQDGKLLGFDDFVKQYRESDPAAFASGEKPPRFSDTATGRPAAGTPKDLANAAIRALAGHSD